MLGVGQDLRADGGRQAVELILERYGKELHAEARCGRATQRAPWSPPEMDTFDHFHPKTSKTDHGKPDFIMISS